MRQVRLALLTLGVCVALAAPSPAAPSSAVVDKGVVYVAGLPSMVAGDLRVFLYAIDATTGAVLWGTTTGGTVYSTPTVVKGVVYVGHDGAASLSAIDAATGEIRWQTNTGGTVYSAPTVVKGVVYVGHDGAASLSAVDATTGQILWQDALDGAVLTSPAVVKDSIFAVSATGSVYAIDATTGAISWVTWFKP
jgi:outer membrane protein assembly factor BamB